MTIAVFLDRDGTLNEEVGYIRQVEDLHLIAGAAQAIARLNTHHIYAILTTNQSGPARGYYDEAHVNALNARLEALLKAEGNAWLDAVFYSPYLPDGSVPEYTRESHCRKPNTGMIEAAVKQFPDIDLAQSYVIGDKATDVEFGVNAGCKSILLRTGYGERVISGDYQTLSHNPYWVCRDISEAVDRILQEQQGG